MIALDFNVHGLRLRVSTESDEVAGSALRLLGSFTHPAGSHPGALLPSAEPLLLRITGKQTGLLGELSPQAVPVADSQKLTRRMPAIWPYTVYHEPGARVMFFHDHALVRISHDCTCAQMFLITPDRMSPEILDVCLHYSIVEMLRGGGLYPVHAAAVEKSGRGVLIVGRSGAGKTTSCLALVRAGYRCLADDHPLLRERSGTPEICAFLDRVNVTARTIEFFPEVSHAGDPRPTGQGKTALSLSGIYPYHRTQTAPASLVLFIEIVDSARSHLEPVARSAALEKLLPFVLALHDIKTARRQFVGLARLVAAAVSYRLYYGRDVADLPLLIDPLLERCAQPCA